MKNKWKITELGEVCKFNYGKGLPKRKRINGIYPVYGSGGIVDYNKEYYIEGPGIIVGRKGTIGSVYFEKRNFFPIDTVFYIEEDKNVYNIRFLYYLLLNLGLNRLNSDAAVPGLNRNIAYHQKISLPSLNIQNKISSILSTYDDLIENNTRRIQIPEEMAQLIYQEWFVSFRFPGHEKVKFVNSELGKIPEEWEVIKVGDILEKVKRKKKVKKQNYEHDGTIPVVDQGREFIGGYTTDIETSYSDSLPIIVFGDHTRVLKYVDFPFACGADGTQLLKPNTERMPVALFYYALKYIDLSDFAYSRHFKFLKEKKVIVPDEQTARIFVGVVKPLRKQIKCLLNSNNNLRRTRDLLLPKLISGEVDVSDLDIAVR